MERWLFAIRAFSRRIRENWPLVASVLALLGAGTLAAAGSLTSAVIAISQGMANSQDFLITTQVVELAVIATLTLNLGFRISALSEKNDDISKKMSKVEEELKATHEYILRNNDVYGSDEDTPGFWATISTGTLWSVRGELVQEVRAHDHSTDSDRVVFEMSEVCALIWKRRCEASTRFKLVVPPGVRQSPNRRNSNVVEIHNDRYDLEYIARIAAWLKYLDDNGVPVSASVDIYFSDAVVNSDESAFLHELPRNVNGNRDARLITYQSARSSLLEIEGPRLVTWTTSADHIASARVRLKHCLENGTHWSCAQVWSVFQDAMPETWGEASLRAAPTFIDFDPHNPPKLDFEMVDTGDGNFSIWDSTGNKTDKRNRSGIRAKLRFLPLKELGKR